MSHVEQQREQHAQRMREKAEEKREQAEGASGAIADRAGQWDLDGLDPTFVRRQGFLVNFLMDHYWRMEMEGWDRLPDAPVLLIGIHSGAPFPIDAWTVGLQWFRRFGEDRPLHGTAHDALMAAPVLGTYFRKMGALPAAPDSIASALAVGHDVVLWPGGDVDALRPWTERDKAVLAERQGFIKLALQAQVPIVPIATVGGADTQPIIARGRGIAQKLGLDKLLRAQTLPLGFSIPWGVNLAILPNIPMPAKIRTEFQWPVTFEDAPEDAAEDDDYVETKFREVESAIQDGMTRLAGRRSFPIFG